MFDVFSRIVHNFKCFFLEKEIRDDTCYLIYFTIVSKCVLCILNFCINKCIIIYNHKNKLFKEIIVQIKE